MIEFVTLGGPGSGNHGHAGRPGQVGGSSSSSSPLAHPSAVIGFNFQTRGLTEPAKAYIAKHGQEFIAGERPDDVEQGTPNECYRNTSLLVLEREDLAYVEGYASKTPGGLAMLHAWAVDKDDNVVDPTLEDQQKWLYFGVKYDRKAYLKHLFKAQYHGVLGSTDAVAKQVITTDGAKLRGKLKTLGGPGSGNFGHSGRPGRVGGSGKGSAAYYHGTSIAAAEKIKEEGLKPDHLVWVATSLDTALGYGYANADKNQDFAVIVVKRTPESEDLLNDYSRVAKLPQNLTYATPKAIPPHLIKEIRVYNREQKYESFSKPLRVLGSDDVFVTALLDKPRTLGGPGSGNFGHAGRPGQVGGSASLRMSDVSALDNAIDKSLDRLTDDEREAFVLDSLSSRLAKSDAISTVPFITTGGELARARAEASQRMVLWAKTSGDSVREAVQQQRAVAEEFGLDATLGHLDTRSDDTIPTDLDRAYARAEYDNTQAWLKENGFNEVTVFRGMHDSEHINAQGLGQGVPDTVNMQPASSWTTDLDTAIAFSQMGNRGKRVLATRVPASRVLSTSATGRGAYGEREVVLLGGPTDVLSWELLDGPPSWQNAKVVSRRIETKLGGGQ